MPEQQPPQPLTEAELSTRLHLLAAQGTAAAPTTGAQVRGRAVRRRRARRGALCATALAALAAVAGGAPDSPTRAPVPPAAPPPAPVQRVTIDLDAHTLAVEGRKFRISGLDEACPIGETLVTVRAKHPALKMPPNSAAKYVASARVRRWAVTFTDRAHRQRLLMGALYPVEGLGSIGNDAGPGSVDLSPSDGKWVYDAIRVGARVEIRGHQGAKPAPDSECYERMPVGGDAGTG
ncbi:hypothetical protein AB0C59_29875 [Streptomyces sp. NPDC048664]|uniref:hypothetical protein n=1 Tax=Streptomyces sp. NPDC048664 TaxID=3154505 RepID=UPI00343E0B40